MWITLRPLVPEETKKVWIASFWMFMLIFRHIQYRKIITSLRRCPIRTPIKLPMQFVSGWTRALGDHRCNYPPADQKSDSERDRGIRLWPLLYRSHNRHLATVRRWCPLQCLWVPVKGWPNHRSVREPFRRTEGEKHLRQHSPSCHRSRSLRSDPLLKRARNCPLPKIWGSASRRSGSLELPKFLCVQSSIWSEPRKFPRKIKHR